MHAHATILKTECNYTGTLPWWDEALDASSNDFFQSSKWFGANGSPVDNCVTTGPFANRTEHIGPLEETTDYCFARKFNQSKRVSYGARANIDAGYEFGGVELEDFYGYMALYPHVAGHQAVGGVVSLRGSLKECELC